MLVLALATAALNAGGGGTYASVAPRSRARSARTSATFRSVEASKRHIVGRSTAKAAHEAAQSRPPETTDVRSDVAEATSALRSCPSSGPVE